MILLFISLIQFYFSKNEAFLNAYVKYFFSPLQRFKTSIFNKIPFSIGDILYGLIIILLIYNIAKIVYQTVNRRRWKLNFKPQLYKAGLFIMIVYLMFVILWSINYQRPKIKEQWNVANILKLDDSNQIKLQDFLVNKINGLEMDKISKINDVKKLNATIYHQYKNKYGNKIPKLNTDKSIFGSLLQNVGVQGYYNPLTSEAQFNHLIPEFVHPFVIAHEMAHQMGVASEGDANLVGYYICASSEEAWLQYSAYMKVFIYNNRKLENFNSQLAKEFVDKLPEVAKKDLVAYKNYSEKHKNWLSDVIIPLYNTFLKINGQSGVSEYRNLTDYVYVWEVLGSRSQDVSILPFGNEQQKKYSENLNTF